ncbi:Carbonic anhydrase 2 [Phycisphaerae bacterium RAS1]|nr:Carbonic anhydrase 2 [Phycisphaerae bacterium RAS1]
MPRSPSTLLSVTIAVCTVLVAGCQATSRSLSGAPAIDEQTDPLERLTAGNERFAKDASVHPHLSAAQRHETAVSGQHPFAAILACSDSRVPIEDLFDVGVGDVFVVRVAGNVCADDEAGSIEYAVEHLKTPLVIVLGHEQCGAVTAAVRKAEEHGSIATLLARLAPAADKARGNYPPRSGAALIHEAVRINTWCSMEALISHSAIVRERMKSGTARVVGGVYDIDTGRVSWMGEHPDQEQVVARAESHDAHPAPPSAPAVTTDGGVHGDK